MKKFLLALFVFGALFTAQAQPVYACSCIIPGTPQEELEKSDAVFSGTVMKMEETISGYDVTLQVQEAWKGVEDNLIKVHTGMGGGDCGFSFREGEDYLVYASLVNGELQVYICSLTGTLEGADTESLGVSTVFPGTIEEGAQWIYGAAAFIVVLGMIILVIRKSK